MPAMATPGAAHQQGKAFALELVFGDSGWNNSSMKRHCI